MNTNSSDKDPWLSGEVAAPANPGDRDESTPPTEVTAAVAASDESHDSEPQPETWRLFVAVPLPEAVRKSMAELGTRMDSRLRERVRWTPADNIHVTLQFLGDTETERLPELIACLSENASNSSPMTIAAGKTGAFPLFRNPKILWIGLDGETRRLAQLQGRVEGGLARLGYEPERRKWTAHATVGRVLRGMNGKQAADLGFAWKRMVGPRNYEKFLVDSFTLFRSRLRDSGPVYETVQEFKLGD